MFGNFDSFSFLKRFSTKANKQQKTVLLFCVWKMTAIKISTAAVMETFEQTSKINQSCGLSFHKNRSGKMSGFSSLVDEISRTKFGELLRF